MITYYQEQAQSATNAKKGLEHQIRELNVRLEEAEVAAAKGGKRIVQRLEQRLVEVESELENEQRVSMDNASQVKKNERRIRELNTQLDEEKRSQLRTNDQVVQLQNKIKAYKKQIEETEEIASLNLTKFRKCQHELESAAERADDAEQQLHKQRAYNRSSASMGRDGSPQREMMGRASSMARAGSVRR